MRAKFLPPFGAHGQLVAGSVTNPNTRKYMSIAAVNSCNENVPLFARSQCCEMRRRGCWSTQTTQRSFWTNERWQRLQKRYSHS